MPKQHSSKRIVSFLFGLWRISPVLCSVMLFIRIVSTILGTVVAPIFISQLLTSIANGTANLHNSMGLLIGYTVVLLVGNLILFRIVIGLTFVTETKMQSNIAIRVFKHLNAKSLNFHANNMNGSIVSNANKLNNSIERFWDILTYDGVQIVTTLLSVCAVLSFIFWQYALVLFILSIAIMIVIIKSQSFASSASRQVAEKSSNMTANLADVIGNIATVKSFSKNEYELNRYKNLINEWRQSSISEMKKIVLITSIFGFLTMILNMCAFIAAVYATEYHILNVGTVYLVISYTLSIISVIYSVSNLTRNYIRIIGDAGPMISILDEEVELKDPVKPILLKLNHCEIKFDNISFAHKDNNGALFHNFSLTIKPGEQVGLVGRSGSGKTSLTRLLLRFSDLDDGRILIDGQDIASIAQDDLHTAIGYVSQEPMLFHRSLRENIAYSRPDATDEQIEHVAQQANALDFIKALPKGFETAVGERGVKLSGGQRQRIAIARAILKDAPILVLDEATSALDSENESLIQDALWKLMKGRTSIVIAHRLSTIAKLDRIIVLDEGKIVEQGSHNELLKNKGVYAKLWAHQSGGFIKE